MQGRALTHPSVRVHSPVFGNTSEREVQGGAGKVEQLSVEIGSGAADDRIRMDRPRSAVDIGQGSARLGDEEAACPGVDGRGPEDDVGRDSTGGQVRQRQRGSQ